MKVDKFADIIGVDFYTGVPDSQLKPLCNYLIDKYGIDSHHHVIAANEGNCAAIAAGYHLATGKTAAVYMQNSGEGNIVNPATSLLNDKVYAIPAIFIIGWRGEPGVHDEPQHIFQGEITKKLLDDIDIPYLVVDKDTTEDELSDVMSSFKEHIARGKSVAFVIRKGSLSDAPSVTYSNGYSLTREDAIRHITEASGDDPIISTTGKASRELFELREANNQSHKYDFLTVGSMGHCSSIALAVAINKPKSRIWCVDGDGSALMHMGAMALVGTNRPNNLIHIVINNGSHETVGGMPTVAHKIDLVAIAKACGYPNAVAVDDAEKLDAELKAATSRNELSFIEVRCSIGAREDLGRPTTTTADNKRLFMDYLEEL